MLDPNNPDNIYSYEKTRSIVKEVINFGVSQNEILKIIELLSLELEDREKMLLIVNSIKKEKITEEKENLIL